MLGNMNIKFIMGFIIVWKLLALLSNIVQYCSDNEHVRMEIRVGVNFIRAVKMDGSNEG
jgi:hypothetical protein